MTLIKDQYKIKVQSLEYLPIKVAAFKEGAIYDPTSDTVQIALPPINIDPGTPVDDYDTDFHTGSWDTIDDEYFARVLVGPGGDITLVRGDYDIIVKITDDPEIPVMRAGRLSII